MTVTQPRPVCTTHARPASSSLGSQMTRTASTTSLGDVGCKGLSAPGAITQAARSYPTAWAMLHRLRSVLVRPGRDRLTGTVEVDETWFGGEDIGALLPGVHRVVSLAKHWVLGTHRGSVGDAHLQSYLDEFGYRFNRRTARSRGLLFYRVLELAVDHDPVRYRQLVADSESEKVPSVPLWRRGHPPTLDRPRVDRPGGRLTGLRKSGQMTTPSPANRDDRPRPCRSRGGSGRPRPSRTARSGPTRRS